MRKLGAATALFTVALFAATPGSPAGPLDSAGRSKIEVRITRPSAVPDEFLVGFKARGGQSHGLGSLRASWARRARPIARGFALVEMPRGTSLSRAVAVLRRDPRVSFVEPNYRRWVDVIPNDPLFPQQWALHNEGQGHPVTGASGSSAGIVDADIDVPAAWDTEAGDPETVVAILDSGVDVSHPDLAPNLWSNPAEVAGNAVDDDGNGFVDDIHGWDFADNDASLIENNNAYFGWDHGTHVAGIAAAAMNDARGIAGVCPQCRIMVLKFFEPIDTDRDGAKDEMGGNIAAEVKAIDYAIAMGADVINASFGAYLTWSKAERTALKRAARAGITIVLAAGNESVDNDMFMPTDVDLDGEIDGFSPSFPAGYELRGPVVVAASNDRDENGYSTACAARSGSRDYPCSFTNWGHESVDVSAPGVDIVSTLPGGGYGAADGTSMAVPHVAGLAALVKSHRPGYSSTQVRNAILNSVDLPPGLRRLYAFAGERATGQFTRTGGRVNALSALSAPTARSHGASDGTIATARRMRRRAVADIGWPEDVNDLYRKKLVRGRSYAAVLDGPERGDLDLVVYHPKVKDLWQVQPGCLGVRRGACRIVAWPRLVGSDERADFKARRSGWHYFQVAAYPFTSGTYRLNVRRV